MSTLCLLCQPRPVDKNCWYLLLKMLVRLLMKLYSHHFLAGGKNVSRLRNLSFESIRQYVESHPFKLCKGQVNSNPFEHVHPRFPSTFARFLPSHILSRLILRGKRLSALCECMKMSTQCSKQWCLCF